MTSKETYEKVIELFKQGKKSSEISKKAYVSVSTVNDLVKYHYHVATVKEARQKAYLETR